MGRCDWSDGDADAEYTKGAYFRGRLAAVKLYDRALTPEEAAEHYASGFQTKALDVSVTTVPWLRRMLVHVDGDT